MTKNLISKTFKDPPVLETARLILRRMRPSDYIDMYEYARREDVTKYLLWHPHTDKFQTLRYLTYISTRYKSGQFYDWAVIERESEKMIGTCGFTTFDLEANSGEIGYVLNPDFWGRGYATEAVSRVVAFGFDVLELNRIEAKFMEKNSASLRVMEKAGMTFEGIGRQAMLIKGKYENVGVSAILKSDYGKGRQK